MGLRRTGANSMNASRTLVAACAALLCACAQAQSSTRYLCTLLDGSKLWVAQDLHKAFPFAAQCTAAATTTAPVVAPSEPAPPATTWINAPPREPAHSTRTKGSKVPSGFFNLPEDLAREIEAASLLQQLDPVLVAALIYTESRYRSNARSPKGALGLMQLMPATARRYGVDDEASLFDRQVNLRVGTQHLRMLQLRYAPRLDLTLAAYNAGEGAVTKYHEKVPPYPETQAYVADILGLLEQVPRVQLNLLR
jgi:soluble lytic murein transglycosylase-like protein